MSASSLVRRIEYRENDGRITTQAASIKFGLHTRVLQNLAADPRLTVQKSSSASGPRLFIESELAAILAVREQIESVSSVGLRLGVPNAVVRELAAAALIEAENGPVVHTVVGDEYYRRASVDRLIKRIGT